MPTKPLTITTDIKDLHALIVQKQLTKDTSNDDTSIIRFKSDVYKDVAQNQISMF